MMPVTCRTNKCGVTAEDSDAVSGDERGIGTKVADPADSLDPSQAAVAAHRDALRAAAMEQLLEEGPFNPKLLVQSMRFPLEVSPFMYSLVHTVASQGYSFAVANAAPENTCPAGYRAVHELGER